MSSTVYNYDPFMVVSTTCGAPRSIDEDIYTVRGCGKIYFLPNIDGTIICRMILQIHRRYLSLAVATYREP
jgi:hypothetical protein